jgi:hypothetical protein
MRTLLGKFGFVAGEDDDLATIAERLSAGLAGEARFMQGMRIATAARR